MLMTVLRYETDEQQNCKLFFFLLSKSLHLNNSILILDKCAYLLERSMVQRSRECQCNPNGEHTNLTFGLNFVSMGSMYYVYHMILLWPSFVTEGMAGLSFCAQCVLSIDEVDKLSHKIHVSENRHNLKLLLLDTFMTGYLTC